MNNLHKFLQIEGTTRVQILVYALVSKEKTQADREKLAAWAMHRNRWLFEHDEWPVNVLLDEIELEHQTFLPSTIGASMERVMSELHVNVCFCMLDGVFDDVNELFAHEATSIYAYLLRGGDLNMAMNDDLRHSDAWRDAIYGLRDFLFTL